MSEYIISRDKLSHNIKLLKQLANGVPIWAVVKGDGYGLGILPLSKLLCDHGIRHFCVTEIEEARTLRSIGDVQILMLRSITDSQMLRELIELDVIVTVGSTEAAQAIEAASGGHTVRAHLKIDTGMGRFGFRPDDTAPIFRVYHDFPHISVRGIYTHFNCAFADDELTKREFSAFSELLASLRANGIDPGTAHCCNSSAFFKFPHMHLNAVRLGSAILGRLAFPTKLQPVGYVQTRVDDVHTLKKGETTGYGAIWTAKKETELAIIPIGWYHGLRVSCREDKSRKLDCLRGILSNLRTMLRPQYTTVEIAGNTCRVVGAIGMLHCAADVTGLGIAPGARVTLQINPLHTHGLPIRFE